MYYNCAILRYIGIKYIDFWSYEMANKELKVTKSHELTQANFSEFSLSSYRVFEHILAKLQHYDQENNLITLSLSDRNVSLSADEYATEFGVDQSHVYGILKFAVDQLMKTSYSIKSGKNILKINVCSQAYYRSETGIIDIRFTEEIMPHIAGLAEKFTMYKLNDLSGLDSIYSTRLFQLLMQWKTIGEFKISIPDLRFALGCTNKFKLYGHFKQDVFGHAVNEINRKFDINLTFKEIKTGRPVTDILFKFKAIQRQQFYDLYQQKMRTKVSNFKKKSEKKIIQIKTNSKEITPSASEIFFHKTPQKSNHIVNHKLEIHIEQSAIGAAQLENSAALPVDNTPHISASNPALTNTPLSVQEIQESNEPPLETVIENVKPAHAMKEDENLVPQKKKIFFGLF